MPIKFSPHYRITSGMAKNLMRIEAAKEKALFLPLTPVVLSSLRETAQLYTTHYSTMIEGNRLLPEQITAVLKQDRHFPGRERDENEIKGYYAALIKVEQLVASGALVTEKLIQTLHALLMADGRSKVKLTPYREGKNLIRDGSTRSIVYMPPEAKDVPMLMKAMVNWIQHATDIPCPIVAGIAHYQFATIHPYYDGNGRTARLLTTLILHLGGYDLKGLYSLEEYYARNLYAYYAAISIGESHNYYMGRADADITSWVEYFVEGVAVSFEAVLRRMAETAIVGSEDQSVLLRKLEPRQRKVLSLFQEFDTVTSKQIGQLFGFKTRTSTQICKEWVENGFLKVVDSSNKGRKYRLSKKYEELIK